MATLPKDAVVQAFLADHKKFMRLLNDVATALESRDVTTAKAVAIELDEVAGPHIAFEEGVLYPSLDATTHEREFVQNLYSEHQELRQAVAELVKQETISEQRIADLHKAFVEGLAHADHCGTLISSLSAMDECEQSDALDELKQLRARKVKWTDLRKET